MDNLSLMDSSVGGLEDSRLRASSINSVECNEEEELMERVKKIERMAKLLLE